MNGKVIEPSSIQEYIILKWEIISISYLLYKNFYVVINHFEAILRICTASLLKFLVCA